MPFGEGFEFHVFNKNNRELGIVSGRYGWYERHGFDGKTPPGIPRDALNQINGANVKELRKQGILPEKGKADIKGGKYLFPGRVIFGAVQILGIAQGGVADYGAYQEGKSNNRSITEQYKDRWRQNSDQKYINSVIGPLPNPCYNGSCEIY